ncbi:cytochrome P450 [Mycena alexandri]|uniref:Cytochrome P450 n=1 Tax=Mycena alexandri TaxID=1745969 RepID=A0AAD6WK10_9AGAR|nr:cytochrome P450 [Mycena alexandri]
MVADSAALRFILNSPHLKYTTAFENLLQLFYDPKFEEHKVLRVALNAGFTPAVVRSHQGVFEKMALKLTEQLENSSQGTINICPLLNAATLSTVAEALLGQSLEELGEELVQSNFQIVALGASQSRAHVLFDAVASHLPACIFRAAGHLPTQSLKILRDAKMLMHELGNRIVREKTVAASNGLDTGSDVLGLLCSGKHGLPGDIAAAQVAAFLLAGQDSPANTLALGLRALARLPEFQAAFRAEISARAESVAYNSMPLLNSFIKEMLRMYPALPTCV